MESGRVGDRFSVGDVAGRGGMGTVYRAIDERTGRPVALKVLRDADPQGETRFRREAEALAQLNHPGVVRYVAHGRTPAGEPFLVMEWIDGEDLAARLVRGPLPAAHALALARALAQALAAVHAQGVVHRDIKPHNILLAGRDPTEPVLVDFGIARASAASVLTGTGKIIGTPQYMAPEQIQGRSELDARADLFSLGCVLFECLTGRAAFVGEHVMAVLAKILVDRPPTLAELGLPAPRALEALLAGLLAKRPEERPASAGAVAAALEACAATLTGDRLATLEAAGVPDAGGDALGAREQRAVAVVMASGVSSHDALLDTATPEDSARLDLGLTATIDPHGGQLCRLGGDRIVITFSGEREATDQAARAARCGLALGRAYPTARVALALGRAQMERVPVGEVIDRAAALLERAAPARVRTDAASAGLLDRQFSVEAAGDDLEVLAAFASDERPRTLLGHATACVGRERELATLSACVDEVLGERVARAVLISGASGAGKSRLRHEALERLRQREGSAVIYLARAEALRAGSPLDLLAGLVRACAAITATDSAEEARAKLVAVVRRGLADETARVDVAEFLGEMIGAGFPAEASPRLAVAREDARLMGAHMQRAWLALVGAECRAHPVILVVEDLQWGDQQTVRFLDAALREHAEQPLLVLAIARPEVHERFPGLWKARNVTELAVGGLPARACERIVREVLGDVDPALRARIVQHADGNALYLEELIRAAAHGNLDELPLSVLAMVQARLERLESGQRRLLRAASILGEAFARDGAAALVGETAEAVEVALERLVEGEVVVRRGDPEGGDFAFRHALVREAAYAMLTDADRRLGHRLAAAWLETQGEGDALLLAQHHERADDPAAAAPAWARAARQALDRNDYEAAMTRGARAVELGAGGAALAEALVVRGKALASLGRFVDAERELEAGLAATPADAPERRMELLRELYYVGTFRQVPAALRRAGTEAMALARQLGRADLEAEATAALATADHAEARLDTAVTAYRRAVAGIADRPSSVVSLSGILLYHVGLHDEGEQVMRRMLRLAVDNRDAATSVIVRANIGLTLAARGRYAEARAEFAESRAEAERCGLGTLAARTVSISSGHRLDVLDLDGAEAAAGEACELGRRLEFQTPRISSSIDLAFVALRRGDATRAATILDEIAGVVEKGIGFHGWLWRERVGVARAELDALRGEFAAALARADASIAECSAHRRLKYRVSAQLVRARALRALDRAGEAVAELTALLAGSEPLDPATRLRTAAALLAISSESVARTAGEESAARIEAALPPADRPAFRAAAAGLLA